MAKFHINKKGVPSICKAKQGNCPFGGAEQHFNNIEEAQSYADKLNEDKYGILQNVDSDVHKVYDIPPGTPWQSRIDKDDFVNNGHELKKAKNTWVHLNNKGDVIGTMYDPMVIYDNDGELIEIVDMDDYSTKISAQGLKALKLLSDFNLVSKDVINATSNVQFYSPKTKINKDMDEFKKHERIKTMEKEILGINALKERIKVRGANKTSDLFRNHDKQDEMSNHFIKIENKNREWANKSNKYTNPKAIDYNPREDNWEDLPSAKDFPLNAWKDNNLDLQMINNKWAIINDKGDICGTLNEPVVAVNFGTESIEAIGEYKTINKHCEDARECKELKEGEPSPLDKLGLVTFDNKNNDLSKIRNLFKFAWAFRERNNN